MAKYIHLFETVTEKNNYVNGNEYQEPFVACIVGNSNVFYNESATQEEH